MSIAKRIGSSTFLAPMAIWVLVNVVGGALIGYGSLSWMPRLFYPLGLGTLMAMISIFDQRATIRAFEGGEALWHEVPGRVRWLFMLRLFLIRALIISAFGIGAAFLAGYLFADYGL
jgi:hypothetical protein